MTRAIGSVVGAAALSWFVGCSSQAACGASAPCADSANARGSTADGGGASAGTSKRRVLAVHLAEGWNCQGYGGLPSTGNCWREMEVGIETAGAFTCGSYEECVAAEAGLHCPPTSAGAIYYDYAGCAREGAPSLGKRYSIGDNQGREVFPIGDEEFRTVADLVESQAFELAWAGGRDECLAGHLESNLTITVLWDDGQEEAFLHAAQCLLLPDHVYAKVFDAFADLRRASLYCENHNEMIPPAEVFQATRGACIPCGGTC